MLKSGILFVNKKSGCTSKDVSRLIEKKIPQKLKLGHVGTLDPLASGVLAIAIGSATRLQNYLLEGHKKYQFTFELGYQTDTLDCEGQVELKAEWQNLQDEHVHAIVENFPRQYAQIPPLYSAVKLAGKSLHKWARAGKGSKVDLSQLKRNVVIHSLEVLKVQLPFITLNTTVSKGTYIRCLARDIANNLGTCATVTELIRTEALGVSLNQTVPFADLERATIDDLNKWIIPISEIKHPDIVPMRIKTLTDEAKLRNGQIISIDSFTAPSDKTLLLFNEDNEVFGIAKALLDDKKNLILKMIRGL